MWVRFVRQSNVVETDGHIILIGKRSFFSGNRCGSGNGRIILVEDEISEATGVTGIKSSIKPS
jgi:hypothetical protein